MAKFLDEPGLGKVFSIIKTNFEKKGKITIGTTEKTVTTKDLTITDSNDTYKAIVTTPYETNGAMKFWK